MAGQVLGNVTTSPLLIRLNNVHLSHAILEVCIYIYSLSHILFWSVQ